jgi:plasmid stability protein
MHTIQIRNLPEDIYEGVKKAATDTKRSMTQLVIHAITEFLEEHKNTENIKSRKQKALKNIEALHKNNPPMNVKLAMKWIKEDRK